MTNLQFRIHHVTKRNERELDDTMCTTKKDVLVIK